MKALLTMPLESSLGHFQVGLTEVEYDYPAWNKIYSIYKNEICTFLSGTLHPNCQDSSGRPRRDISTILQILNDLLSATRHYQGMPASLTQLRYQTQCSGTASPMPTPPPSPPAEPSGLSTKATSVPSPSQTTLHPLVQSQVRMCKPPGE